MTEVNSNHTTISSNGQAYRAYLESVLPVLDDLSVMEYHKSPLPSPVDGILTQVVSAFTGWPVLVREHFLTSLPSDKRGIFGIFGHRAATLAVRNNDVELLRLGLVGNVIANTPIPANRNVDIALAVFYHCARKLDMDPKDVFADVAEFATDELATRLISFGQREGISLKQFGWREIKTPDGVHYKFEW